MASGAFFYGYFGYFGCSFENQQKSLNHLGCTTCDPEYLTHHTESIAYDISDCKKTSSNKKIYIDIYRYFETS
jgi:hypothetical protein